MTLRLLAQRAPCATLCPSEVARALVAAAGAQAPAEDWRAAMPAVHDAVDALVAAGAVRLSWKGEARPTRAGPYRIGWPR
ncbi:DUF3253 domain-containing protein [Sphingomonas sp.]|uniref:DUF3253 domain-containing protein n=1 Tax=Sphingomonas sp. TaxID=28214 RepID=UPI003B3A41F6